MGKKEKSKIKAAVTIARSAFTLFLFSAVAVSSTSGLAAPQDDATSEDQQQSSSGTRLNFSGKPLHLSCVRSLRDLDKNKLECFGNVYIRRPSELLTADYAILDLDNEKLHAEGNVVYFTSDMVIYGTKMDFDFNTETGVIENGRVEADKYQLLGERIEKLSPDRFKATDGEYTTCRDCPASWKIRGSTVDMQVEGYAFMTDVFIKVNEASTAWFPFFIFPVKKKRQSGLLPPRFRQDAESGTTFQLPFFWAISRSQDLTISPGLYSRKGLKGDLQYRYVFGQRTKGQLDAHYLRDRTFVWPYNNRWGLHYAHNWVLPGGIEQKTDYVDASDRDYVRKIGDDMPGLNEPGLISETSFSKSSRDLSTWVSAKRVRNNLTTNLVGFDRGAVQTLPSFSILTADRRMGNSFPLHWGISADYTRFWRVGESFDVLDEDGIPNPNSNLFEPGRTPLRRGQRLTVVPELYYTMRLFDVFELVPSVQYRMYRYLFDDNVAAGTSRAYLLAQTELATTLENVYDGKVKHKIRPSIKYSNIPLIQEDQNHPFIRQLRRSGYQFDQNDIVPISSSSPLYFVPLGNSVTYKVSNKFILKSEDDAASYKKVVDLAVGQSFNFKDLYEPMSRVFALLSVDTLRIRGSGEVYYYPYFHGGNKPTYNLSLTYIFAKYTRRLLEFERNISVRYSLDQVIGNSNNIGGGFNFSINDYFAIISSIDYQLPYGKDSVEQPGRIQNMSGGLTFQSPSQCYKIQLAASWTINKRGVDFAPTLLLNLTGDGFMNPQDGGSMARSGGQ